MADLQLYSLATPNGQKVGVALEEMGLDYDAHLVDITKGDQFKPEFVAINPNSKIPALVDLKGAGGEPLAIMESGAILVYLAEKSGQFLPEESAARSVTLQWLFFQVGGIGPMFGQFGHFYKYARSKIDHPYPVERYSTESKRLMSVLEKRLQESEYLAGADYTIADMATFPWVMGLRDHYEADEVLGLKSYTHVWNWVDKCSTRPASARGLLVCKPESW